MANRKKFSSPLHAPPHVYQLAQLVYEEFQKLYDVCGESACATLLSLNLKMLEEIEQFSENRTQLVADYRVSENSDILFQLEREKKLRNTATLRLNALEDELSASKKISDDKIDKLESLLRHHEMLTKNAQDHASRLEERICQTQNELTSMHERYNELLKGYVDQIERSKTSSHKLDQTFDDASNSEENPNVQGRANPVYDNSYQLIPNEPKPVTARGKSDELVASFIDLMDDDNMDFESVIAPASEKDEEDEVAETGDCTEDSVMMKEVSKLIQENQDLCATKNALNVVKNDLIHKLDDVTGEKLMLLKEVEHLRHHRDQCKKEANRLVRRMTEYQTYVAHLQTRLKLYEEVDYFSLSTEPSSSSSGLQHASSCAVLDQLPANPTVASLKSSKALGGSLDRLTAVPVQHVQSVAVDPTSSTRATEMHAARPNFSLGSSKQASGYESSTFRKSTSPADSDELCFTRREMAQLVAERNHYKQSLLELQDAVRYTAALRAGFSGSSAAHGNVLDINHKRSPRFAELFFSGLRSMADDIASGIFDLLTEAEPVFPPIAHDAAHDQGAVAIRNQRRSGFSSELRRMFGHFLGHAAGQGAEAVLGTGNDFAAGVTSQSLTNAILDGSESNTNVCTSSHMLAQYSLPVGE